MSLTHVKSAIAGSVSLPFTFLRQSSIPLVEYRMLDASTTAAAPTTLPLVIPGNQELAVVDFDWRHQIAKLSIRISVRCKDLGDICCTSRGIAHFVLNFVAMATRIGRGKIQFSSIWWSISKNSPTDAKNLTDISYTSRVIANSVPNFVVMATGVSQGKTQLAAFTVMLSTVLCSALNSIVSASHSQWPRTYPPPRLADMNCNPTDMKDRQESSHYLRDY